MTVTATILVVDDDERTLVMLQRMLSQAGYMVVTAADATAASAFAADNAPDLIVLDVMMPGVDGVALSRRFKADVRTRGVPVLLMTAVPDLDGIVQRAGAEAVIRKPIDRGELLAWARCLLMAKRNHDDCARAEDAMVTLASTIEMRSWHRPDHAQEVADYSVALADHLNLSQDHTVLIRRAALLHDIGHACVPDAILQKTTPLTPEELQQIREHAAFGAALCQSLRHGPEIASIVRSHHERWDGTGYPDGLSEESIPIGARIIAVADALSALCAERPHRRKLSIEDALDVLRFGAGDQWDPLLVVAIDRLITERPTPAAHR